MTDEDLYFLQNVTAGYVGDYVVFWNDKGGYTTDIDSAKKFTSKDADDIIRATRGSHSWTKWPVKLVEDNITRVVNITQLQHAQNQLSQLTYFDRRLGRICYVLPHMQ